MSSIEKANPGERPSANVINRLAEESARVGSVSSRHSLFQSRANGVAAMRRPRGLFPPEPIASRAHPFQVIDASDEESASVRIRYGQVNSITPGIGTALLSDDPPPTLVVESSGVIYLEVTVNATTGVAEDVEVKWAESLPESTNTEGFITIAEVTVAEVGGDSRVTAIHQSVTHSLQHRRCGVDDHHFWAV